ncbi:putative vitellogenin receptor yl [Anticarsia gemmatalis]|uniref:putative vitellogenin receptor yl n=1 Tax=Anticarsia gemmatalis TaxID=129554 RepID=UPI003F77625E
MNQLESSIIILVICVAFSWQYANELESMDYSEYSAGCIDEDTLPCWSGGCFLQSQFCDGNIDCDDASDENFCTLHKPDAEVCNMTHQFSCADGNGCIPNMWICNNETDCDDGSDELNCTQLPDNNNSSCKGFQCGDGKCISNLWVCDGVYDCEDKSDEYKHDLCRRVSLPHAILDGSFCQELPSLGERNYKCSDSSYCLPSHMMCDGMQDCRDGSDEGPFCANWHTMCNNYTCLGNETRCSPERHGPSCLCVPNLSMRQYNYVTHQCDDVDECAMERPQCSQTCINGDGHFTCECEPGYTKDEFRYLCYATGPEAMLFFSTRNDIRYLKVKSKQMVIVASDIKQAHGVSFDGTYVYWVETAQGHQTIFKAQLDDIKETKQVLVGLGLEEPGDIAVDYLGGNIYFSDSERGIISACRADGSICTTVKTQSKHPRFVTLDAKNGKMYWADWQSRAVIMSARMDGSQPDVLVDHLRGFASGLALDAPNGRLYYVDHTIKVVLLNGKHVYSLFEEPFHHPYSISVFENTVYWSDWTSNTIQTMDKIHGSAQKRNVLLKLDTPVLGMHMYHPVLVNASSNPCSSNNCSHLCFVTSNTSHVCACPDGMDIHDNTCTRPSDYRAKYLVVAGGELFTRFQYDELGNPESHATHFAIGRVQAMAYDSFRDTLYLYDGQRKMISCVNISDFTLGHTQRVVFDGLENVVDMDYDYASDNLYIADAGRRVVEAFSIRTQRRALVHRFPTHEVPISLCVMPDYGRMMVAVVESEQHNIIHIDSMGLDGEDRKHIILNNLKGPHVRLRYVQHLDNVFISDESNGAIDFMHPDGTGLEGYRELSTTVASLAVADNYVFWTDRRTPRLFWSDIHETTHKIRRIDLALLPNNTQLLIQATSPPPDKKDPLFNHPCLKNICSDVCVQEPHDPAHSSTFHMGYKCLCRPGYVLRDGKCHSVVVCDDDEVVCHKSNACVDQEAKCNGVADCPLGEDEEGCPVVEPTDICGPDEVFCNNKCLNKRTTTMCDGKPIDPEEHSPCIVTEYQCANSSICISRSLLCDGSTDCPRADDELSSECDTFTCFDTEFMCTSGSCIASSWLCDGDLDCSDGSDEIDCEHTTCRPGNFRCRSRECIELSKRCDGHQDCFDFSDEEDCDEETIVDVTEVEPRCGFGEFACEHNTSICLPHSARCNMKTECPGGSDEAGCEKRCAPLGLFACEQELQCVSLHRVCNGYRDCADGSDETPDACGRVNRTSVLYPAHSSGPCIDAFRCRNGQCVEWTQLCDNRTDCVDGSDEGGLCLTSCISDKCSYECTPTPLGAHCTCHEGYALGQDGYTCEDVDECETDVCSQGCHNIPGGFICTCHHGYALRADRRSCKAIKGNMAVLYVSGNSVRSVSSDGHGAVEFFDQKTPGITDLDVHVRQSKLYVTSTETGKLLEVNSSQNVIAVTNIGRPTRVAVDWVTGNVYFVDSTPTAMRVRVCHVTKKRCATLQKLPSDAEVTALIVDPSARRMFYCVTRELESVVWSASLSGRHVTDLTTVKHCTGLAVDSFKKKLFVAETGPSHILRMDYEGESHKKILADQPQLQAPHGLVIFQDHVYYLVANSSRLGRCQLFGHKRCENYLYRVFNANTFVIRHDSIQRDDLVDDCEGVVCSNVCALDADGPKCVCDDGSLAVDGVCPELEKSLQPLFNGWSYEDMVTAHSVSFNIITVVLVLFALYLCVFVYYHFVFKPKRARASAYTEVRFQNTSPNSSAISSNSTIQMSTEPGSTVAHEFVNPLQYVRNMWYSSFRKQTRPTFLNEVAVNMPSSPPQQDLSDTESDLDDKEHKRILRHRL